MGSVSFADATWSERSVFAFFMTLWIVYGLLNQLAKLRQINFDATTLVWSQEVLKIVLSFGLFCVQDGGLLEFLRTAREHWVMLCWYMIPALLYALTDVLTYINLRSFDPATYYLLSEMKLVVTQGVHQVLFKRRLNCFHWLALAIITGGCAMKTWDSMEQHVAGASSASDNRDQNPTWINYVILVVQILASTVAGVYNEKLLKDKLAIPINLQNMCLYADGIAFLTLGLACGLSENTLSEALSLTNVRSLFGQPTILAMACVMSTAGIVTSRFLKVFDSVRKSIAASLVVVLLPFLSRLFFGTEVTFKMVFSICCVALGMYIYSSQPSPGSQNAYNATEYEEDDGDEELFLPALSPVTRDHGPTRSCGKYAHLSQELPVVREERDNEEGLTEEETDLDLSSETHPVMSQDGEAAR